MRPALPSIRCDLARGAARRWAAVGLAVLCAILPAGRAQAPTASEADVKAVWLLNFVRYTDWPASAFDSLQAPIVIGVVGKPAFAPVLEKTFSGKTVKGRSIIVKRLTADQDLKRCQLLYLSASERRRQRELLESVEGHPVLTVGETEDFLDDGGMVQFTLKDNSVRFAVSIDAARPAGMRLQASLLKVALSVRGRYE